MSRLERSIRFVRFFCDGGIRTFDGCLVFLGNLRFGFADLTNRIGAGIIDAHPVIGFDLLGLVLPGLRRSKVVGNPLLAVIDGFADLRHHIFSNAKIDDTDHDQQPENLAAVNFHKLTNLRHYSPDVSRRK